MERPRHVQVFINSYLPCARSVELFLRIPISITLAYAAIDSDWGRSSLARKGIIFGQPLKPENTTPVDSIRFAQMEDKKESTQYFKKIPLREAFMNFGQSLYINPLFKDTQRYIGYPEKFLGILASGLPAGLEKDRAEMARTALKEYKLEDFDSWIYSDLPAVESQETETITAL